MSQDYQARNLRDLSLTSTCHQVLLILPPKHRSNLVPSLHVYCHVLAQATITSCLDASVSSLVDICFLGPPGLLSLYFPSLPPVVIWGMHLLLLQVMWFQGNCLHPGSKGEASDPGQASDFFHSSGHSDWFMVGHMTELRPIRANETQFQDLNMLSGRQHQLLSGQEWMWDGSYGSHLPHTV